MDAYQQPHRYLRPPPPPAQPSPTADHHQHHLYFHQQQQQQQQPPPPPAAPRPPVPPHAQQWYSNQFHYQPLSHSPSPPPPPPSQWTPPPASSAAYPAPPPLPYPTQQHHNNGYPLPPRPPQISQSYPQTNQDWGNSNWTHHNQGWDYTAHNNAQDWAARAKEWASARAAMENQHMQSQFTPVGRPEDQTRFGDQYPQAADFQYAGTQQQSGPVPGYQQFSVQAAPSHQPPVAYQQDTASIGSGPSSYVPDMRLACAGRDGPSAGEANAGFPLQESLRSSPSVHQQEVPSSYSSVTGKEETADQMEHTYRSMPMQISSAQEGQLYAYGNQAADATTDLSDKPLDFAPRFNHEHDLHMPSSYVAHHDSTGTVRGLDPVAAVTSVNSWTSPVAPAVAYPSIPPVIQAGPQHDHSINIASVPGPPAHQYGGFPGPGFQPPIASASAFGLSAGAALHPSTAFPGDTYGVSRKKAPVPNWLKEEIIKNKAAITRSSLDNPKEESESIEDDTGNKSSGKGEQADSKSIDSSRSTEEEDDDEDYVEAARTAAINQEIKRIVTEVLLKVTDELFDEIATKVLSEDDLTIDVDRNTLISNHKVSPPPPAVPTPKASAKVLVPVKAKENETEGSSGRTISGSPGDVLGLGSYASDDDAEDDEIQSSSMQNTRNNGVRKSSLNKLSEDIHDAAENGSVAELEGHNRVQKNLRNDLGKSNSSSAISKLGNNDREYKNAQSSNAISGENNDENNVDRGKLRDGNNDSGLKSTLGEKIAMKTKSELSDADVKKSTNSQSTETRMKSVKNDRNEGEKGFPRKVSGKEPELGRRADEMGNENHRREDGRHSRKEKKDDRNGSRDKMKEQGVKREEEAKESKSRKRSTHLDVDYDRKDVDKHHRAGTKEGIDKKQRSKEEDLVRHKHTSDSSRHKRRRSSSISSKGRNSKDNSISHANGSSDETSDDSKRKSRSRKRNLSPSPVRSRRRQVTRSPHSKHSQRRHSPYSSLETTRGRRSRSRSPVRRQR